MLKARMAALIMMMRRRMLMIKMYCQPATVQLHVTVPADHGGDSANGVHDDEEKEDNEDDDD